MKLDFSGQFFEEYSNIKFHLKQNSSKFNLRLYCWRCRITL